MRILHVDEQNGWRGGEQQASYLIEGLVRRGHECLIAGRPGAPFVTRSHGVPDAVRIELPMRGEADVASAWRLAAAARRHNVDILHAHSSHGHTMALLAQCLGARAKTVVTRRVDFVPKNHTFNRWKYRSPDFTIAISGVIHGILSDFGVPESRLRIVYSCIDPGRFDVDPLPRSELGVPDDAVLLGNVAAMVGHKDHATLIAALPDVLRALPNLHLAIAGDGPLRGAIEKQIRDLPIGDAVHLLGYRDDVPRLMRSFDAFVMSSKEEGLGTSILDAMSCGLPVVATDGGAIPEIVKHEETGFLAPRQNPAALARGIIRAIEDTAAARAVADRARQMVLDRFIVDRMVDGTLGVYEDLIVRKTKQD